MPSQREEEGEGGRGGSDWPRKKGTKKREIEIEKKRKLLKMKEQENEKDIVKEKDRKVEK